MMRFFHLQGEFPQVISEEIPAMYGQKLYDTVKQWKVNSDMVTQQDKVIHQTATELVVVAKIDMSKMIAQWLPRAPKKGPCYRDQEAFPW
jgi:hypothetical protein